MGALGPALPDSLFGNTFGDTDDFSGSCGGAGAPDAEYTFTAPADGTYTFDTQGSQLDTVVYVLDGECMGTELGCNDDGDQSQSVVAVDLVEGQTVTVVVDGNDGTGLPFELRVQTGAFVCPLADIGNTVPGTISGDTTALFDGSSASCGGQAGRDAHYLFTAPATATYSLETFGSSFESVIYVRDGVCAGGELSCGIEGTLVDLVAGQEVTITVDSQFAWGEFDLRIDTLGGACPDTNVGNTVPVNVVGDTTDGDNTDAGTCGGEFSNDDLYLFTAPTDGLYQFDTFGSALDTVLYLQDGGCGGAELGCNDDFEPLVPQSRVIAGLAAGQPVLVGVDGNGAGAYELNIDLVPCPDEPLASVAVQTVFGTTQGGIDKLVGSCSNQAEAPDYTYSFTAPADGEFVFDTLGSAFNTVLYVLDGPACNGNEIACSDNYAGPSSALSVQLTEGETVTVVVDGNFGQQGAFQLNVSQLGGGACPDEDIGSTVPQTVVGTTAGADNTVAGTCGGFTSGDDTYLFTADTDGLYVFDTIGSAYDTVLFLRDADCSGTELACNDNYSFFQESQVGITLAAGQSVIVGVDGAVGTGAYNLNVQYVTCPDLDIDSDFPSNQVGDTFGSVDKVQSVNCFGSDNGSPDFVFEWTAPAADTYTIDMNGSDYDTFLVVQDVACGGAELACNDDFNGLLSQVTVDLAQDQTIMIIASGFSGSVGNFEVNIN